VIETHDTDRETLGISPYMIEVTRIWWRQRGTLTINSAPGALPLLSIILRPWSANSRQYRNVALEHPPVSMMDCNKINNFAQDLSGD
jgi:hypothetical protein